MLATLSKKTSKEVAYLVGKWAVKYGSRVYGSALNYARTAEMAIIPNKIGKLLISSGSKGLAIGFLKFGSTFALFPEAFNETSQAFDKWKKILDGTTLERDKERLARAMGDDIAGIVQKWRHKIGMQSWIDVLTFFIPIPFAGVF